MSEQTGFLESIEEGINGHSDDLSGWTRLDDGRLQVFDGRVTIQAEIYPMEQDNDNIAHVHVFSTLHEHDDEVLDACVMGIGPDREAAIDEAAVIFLTCVIGPIKSFIDKRPVCMTCQAGVRMGHPDSDEVHGDYGMPGLTAFVGPAVVRGFNDQADHPEIDDTKPWFQFVAQSAAPRRIHMAKSTVFCQKNQWSRELEIDGHDVSVKDPLWNPGVKGGGEFGYMTRFAVFEFPMDSSEIERREELDKAIRYFGNTYCRFETIDELYAEMRHQGIDEELFHQIESVSTIAFARHLFEPMGVEFSPTAIRAMRDGNVLTDVPLISMPAYNRARAIAIELSQSMSETDFQRLCCYNAEAHAILQAMDEMGDDLDLSELTAFPCVIPDLHVSDQTMDKAMAALNQMLEQHRNANPPTPEKKPWWKLW